MRMELAPTRWCILWSSVRDSRRVYLGWLVIGTVIIRPTLVQMGIGARPTFVSLERFDSTLGAEVRQSNKTTTSRK